MTSVALGLVISFEPHELDVVRRLLRAVDRPILDAFGVWRVVFVGLALLALTLWAFFWMKSNDSSDELARAVAVNALVIGQVFYLLNSRYKLDSSLSLKAHLGNKYLVMGLARSRFCSSCSPTHRRFKLCSRPRRSRSGFGHGCSSAASCSSLSSRRKS